MDKKRAGPLLKGRQKLLEALGPNFVGDPFDAAVAAIELSGHVAGAPAPVADTHGDGAITIEDLNTSPGGWYEMPDGTKVRGRAKAEAALAALQAA